MKTFVKWYGALLFTLIIGVSGCAKTTKVVTDARLYFDLVKEPGSYAECGYSDRNKKTACEQLDIAEESLRNDRKTEAASAAEKSIQASFKILKGDLDSLLKEILNISKRIRENSI